MEKIWPSLRETERQNIINETMKPIEEIPYGSDFNRTIFFPKGSFRRIVMDQEVRIATICPYYFVIGVAVLHKDARFEAGQTLRRPDGRASATLIPSSISGSGLSSASARIKSRNLAEDRQLDEQVVVLGEPPEDVSAWVFGGQPSSMRLKELSQRGAVSVG
jgi:hypothetical protein